MSPRFHGLPIARRRYRFAVLLLVAALPLPAQADGLLSPGDGSWSSNPQLVDGVPGSHQTPVFDDMFPYSAFDWSLGLKAIALNNSSGMHYEGQLLPTLSFSRQGSRLATTGQFTGQLSKIDNGEFDANLLEFSAGAVYQLAPGASVSSNASLSLSRESPTAFDVPSNVSLPPQQISGSADSTLSQQFGRLNVAVRGNAARDVYGVTTLTDGTEVDNTSLNNTRFGTGLRLGYQLTPVFEVFTDTGVTRTVFDQGSAALGALLNGTTYTVKAGLAAKWDTRLAASASVGLGFEHFDSASLADVRATLYDASLTYMPSSDLTLTGNLSTSIGAPGANGSGTAKIDYEAAIGAAYQVNDWLAWRSSANWHDISYAQGGSSDTGFGVGVGADYLVNQQVKLSADYGFARDTAGTNPASDTHTVTVGMTVRK